MTKPAMKKAAAKHAEIAKMYSRAPSCIYKVLLEQRRSMKKVGRPRALTEADVDGIIEVEDKMVKQANVKTEVSLEKITWFFSGLNIKRLPCLGAIFSLASLCRYDF
jgi:hypothetical protein